MSARLSPSELVGLLNRIFSRFDRLTEKYGLEKIKTIGDAYMVAGGLPERRDDHLDALARLAIDMRDVIAEVDVPPEVELSMRIGIHAGPVVAGVIGEKKFSYDLWGDTVNTASRMESHGVAGAIQVSEAVYAALDSRFEFQQRGEVEIKGKGLMRTYVLRRARA
jgi:class 3 adenylate cyclase